MAGASRHAVGRSKAVVVPVDVSRRALSVCRETAIPSLKWIKSSLSFTLPLTVPEYVV
jgi:hypothetical protein